MKNKCMECGHEFENEELFVFEDSNCTKVLCLGCLVSHFKTISEKEADEDFKEWLKELKK